MMLPTLKSRAPSEQIQPSFPRNREPEAAGVPPLGNRGFVADGAACSRSAERRSGRIRMIELNPAEGLAAADHAVLGDADAVLFDRALAALVVEAVAPGAYAEPLPASIGHDAAAISPRAVKLAEEGWRVVQCVPAQSGFRARRLGIAAVPDRAAQAASRGRAQSLAFTANGLAG